MNRLSICFFSPFSIKGSTRLYSLTQHLSSIGLNVTAILPRRDKHSSLKKEIYIENVNLKHPVQLGKRINFVSLLPYIPSAILDGMLENFDFLYLFKITPVSALPGFVIASLKRRHPFFIDCDDMESLVMKEEGYPAYVYKSTNLLERLLPKRAKGIVAASFRIREKMIEIGVPEERILYLPNGVDPEKFDPDKIDGKLIQEKYNINCPSIVYVGFFNRSSEKDFLLLIRAAKLIQKSGNKVKFLIVGEGKSLPFLRRLIVSLGLDEYFVFAGFREPAPYIAAADVAIVPYVESPLHGGSQKIFEYMAMKKAVVVTNVGELPYHVEHGRTGVIASPTPEDIADKILLLTSDRKQRKTLGELARKRILQYYTWEIHAKNLLSFCLKRIEK